VAKLIDRELQDFGPGGTAGFVRSSTWGSSASIGSDTVVVMPSSKAAITFDTLSPHDRQRTIQASEIVRHRRDSCQFRPTATRILGVRPGGNGGDANRCDAADRADGMAQWRLPQRC
jgi:hypothetical protein